MALRHLGGKQSEMKGSGRYQWTVCAGWRWSEQIGRIR